MVQHEGLLELDALYLFEASPLVAGCREQPEKIRYADGPHLRRYTPDFELVLIDGSSATVEVKPKENAEHPDVRQKLDRVADFYARRGQTFLLLTELHIRAEPRLSNLRWIYHQAPRIRPSLTSAQYVLRRHLNVFPTSMRIAADLLSRYRLDPYSLLMNGALVCNLSEPVTPETLLNLNLESHHDWFRISDRHSF
jgi:TnsA endonuclease N terminal